MAAILAFFIGHWFLSMFFQTFFLHRYASHRMVTMSKFWERVFHFCQWIFQGSSYLIPRAYAVLHREHHAFSDTERDPHSPHHSKNFFDMMWKTATTYNALVKNERETEPRFLGGYPEWKLIETIGDTWISRIGFGAAYTAFYFAFAPHWAWFLLLPAHYLMGPIHGAIVNYGGHMFGYQNFDNNDKSRNTLPVDFLTLGELFQNNHHKFGMAIKFSVRWFEVDPTYIMIRILAALGMVQIATKQEGKYEALPAPAE